MELAIFTKSKAVKTYFNPLLKSRTHSAEILDPAQLEQVLKQNQSGLFVYVDVSGLEETARDSFLQSFPRRKKIRVGIVDPTGLIDDIGRLFHSGAVDYLGKRALTQTFSAKRLDAALRLMPFKDSRVDSEKAEVSTDWKLSGNKWSGIRSGQEYTFCFLFVEIDLIDEWKRKSGQEHLDNVKKAFYRHIERVVSPLSGRIWMWMDMGGLVLFPFDGKQCPAILTCFKLVLDRVIISAEEFTYGTIISYRIALHIGNTVYKARGNTGTIVSGDINFLFHVGQKFAKPGHFYLTEPAVRFIPKGLESCFVDAGVFEDVSMTRMKHPR